MSLSPKIYDNVDKTYDWEESFFGTGTKTGKPSVLGIIKEIPKTLSKGIKSIPKAAKTFVPGLYGALGKNVNTAGKILGERAAYILDKEVKKQYQAGNLDILPTLSDNNVLKNVWKNASAGAIEAAIFKMLPASIKKPLLQRGGIGLLSGLGFAVSEGLTKDYTPKQIIDNAKSYGTFGIVIESLSPYLFQILKTPLTKVPFAAKESIKKFGQEILHPLTKPIEVLTEKTVLNLQAVKRALNDVAGKIEMMGGDVKISNAIRNIKPSTIESQGQFYTQTKNVLQSLKADTPLNLRLLMATTTDFYAPFRFGIKDANIAKEVLKEEFIPKSVSKIWENPAIEQKIAITSQAPTQRILQGITDLATNNGGEAGKEIIEVLTKQESKASVKQLIRTQFGELAAMHLDSEAFIRKFEQTTTKGERQLIPFLKEGITEKTYDILPIPARKVIDKFNGVINGKPQGYNIPPHLQRIGDVARKHYDEAHSFLKEFMDIDYLKDYYNRVWDIPKQAISKIYKGRKLETIAEGVNYGLMPKELDIANLMRIYDNYKNRLWANFKFGNDLKKIIYEGQPVIFSTSDKFPTFWEILTVPEAFQRGLGKISKIAVHPDIAKEVKIVLDQPFTQSAFRAVQTINAFAKKSRLSFSLFHPTALFESAVGEGIGKEAVKLFNPVRLYKELKSGDTYIFRHLEVAKRAVRHRLILEPVSDMQVGIVTKALQDLEWKTRNIPIVSQTTSFVRKANFLWDKSLWEYYQNTLKLMTYEILVEYGLKKFPNKTPDEIGYLAARHANNNFGGLAWEELGISKQWQQALQISFLSPDWSLSTLRQAAEPFSRDPFIRKMGRNFWLRSGLYLFTFANVVNYATTSFFSEDKKGRFLWQNTGKNKLNIFLGYDEQGREKYLRPFKQFKEIMEYFISPLQIIKNKISPVGHIVLDIFGEAYLQEKNVVSSIGQITKSFASNFEPFSVAGNSFLFTLPTKAGYTEYSAREAMIKAIQNQDEKKLKEIFNDTLMNNLDAQKLLSQAKGQVKSEVSKDAKKQAQKILQKLKKMPVEERENYVNELIQDGTLNANVNRWIWKLLIEQKKIEKEKEFYLK